MNDDRKPRTGPIFDVSDIVMSILMFLVFCLFMLFTVGAWALGVAQILEHLLA